MDSININVQFKDINLNKYRLNKNSMNPLYIDRNSESIQEYFDENCDDPTIICIDNEK